MGNPKGNRQATAQSFRESGPSIFSLDVRPARTGIRRFARVLLAAFAVSVMLPAALAAPTMASNFDPGDGPTVVAPNGNSWSAASPNGNSWSAVSPDGNSWSAVSPDGNSWSSLTE